MLRDKVMAFLIINKQFAIKSVLLGENRYVVLLLFLGSVDELLYRIYLE